MTEKHLTNTRFSDFDFHETVQEGIIASGYEFCTPIQAETLPFSMQGKDVAGQAQTGTGKTAAFLLATLHHLLTHPADSHRRKNQPRALILAPTRELAIQIHKDAITMVKNTDLTLGLVYGGTGYNQQREALQAGVDILIGTPGRLIDYFKQKVFDLRAVQVVVMDEADRMFDLGFIKDIRYLLHRTPAPEKRLGLLFSATLSYRVIELAYEHMNNPETIKIETENITADKVTEIAYMVANDEKIPLLIGLMKKLQPKRSMVFVNTKRAAEEVWGYLKGNGIETGVLSGDVPQKKRQSLLSKFQDGEFNVMVATDVAARGLHINAVSHVFNFDLPDDREDYVHRIGRTARAGESGDAVSFVCETYAFSLPDIEDYIGHRIEVGSVTSEILAEVDPKSRVRLERKPRHNNNRGAKNHNGQQRRHHAKKPGQQRNKRPHNQ